MIRTLPPTGAPIRLRDVFNGFRSIISHEDSISDFRDMIREYFEIRNVFLLSSGKAGLYFALGALSTLSKRRNVIIPAYSSYCLAAAVARAGLPVKLCDIDPHYLDFDPEHLSRLVDEKTLAIIPVHPFGYSARLDQVIQIARKCGAFVLEDVAQAAGVDYHDKKAGTLGDLAVFSLGRGKNISAVNGGVILTNTEKISAAIRDQLNTLSRASQLPAVIFGIMISAFLNPYLYSIPANLPFLNIGMNIYDPQFALNEFSSYQAGIGTSVFHRLDEYNSIRRSNAESLEPMLGGIAEINLIKIADGSLPTCLRFPLIFKTTEMRERIFIKLKHERLGVSKNYEQPLNELTEFRDHILNLKDNFPNAEKMCHTLLTIPTHPLVSKQDLRKIAGIVRDACAEMGSRI